MMLHTRRISNTHFCSWRTSLILRPLLYEVVVSTLLLTRRGPREPSVFFLIHDMGLKSVFRDGHRAAIWRLTAEGFFKCSELRFYIGFETAPR
jgi:hypothetical protein